MLGCYAGSATIRLGGARGIDATLAPGDVAVLPAGTGHENLGASDDLNERLPGARK
ncbi:hypothetical protein BH23VER1_BH23VER1_11580 [soil metagenome]